MNSFNISDGAIETASLKDGSVTAAKLGSDVVLYSTYSNGQVYRCLKNLY